MKTAVPAIHESPTPIAKGTTADLRLQGNNSIDVHIFDICPDGQHAIVGNIHHPAESFPVELSRLSPLSPANITIMEQMIQGVEKLTGTKIVSAHTTYCRDGNELDKYSIAIRAPKPITDFPANYKLPKS